MSRHILLSAAAKWLPLWAGEARELVVDLLPTVGLGEDYKDDAWVESSDGVDTVYPSFMIMERDQSMAVLGSKGSRVCGNADGGLHYSKVPAVW